MIRKTRALMVLLVVTFGVMAAGTATASACSTWQYQVTQNATLRWAPGGAVKTTLEADPAGADYDGTIGNVTRRDGSWYYGNWYVTSKTTGGTVYIDNGWVLASSLSYIRCW